jgi:hypothetical protein
MSPEKENTFRALKDEPLLMTSIWCRFGIHKWTRYSEPAKLGTTYCGSVFSPGRGGYYAIMIQEKRCVNCNIPSHRQHFLFEKG